MQPSRADNWELLANQSQLCWSGKIAALGKPSNLNKGMFQYLYLDLEEEKPSFNKAQLSHKKSNLDRIGRSVSALGKMLIWPRRHSPEPAAYPSLSLSFFPCPPSAPAKALSSFSWDLCACLLLMSHFIYQWSSVLTIFVLAQLGLLSLSCTVSVCVAATTHFSGALNNSNLFSHNSVDQKYKIKIHLLAQLYFPWRCWGESVPCLFRLQVAAAPVATSLPPGLLLPKTSWVYVNPLCLFLTNTHPDNLLTTRF